MTPSFVAALGELVKLLPQIRELAARSPSIQEAIVTDNADPTGFRRIRVTREAQAGQSQSDWIPCGRSSSTTDEPIPPPGTSCLIALVGGDPHKPFFLRTLSNATNPPDQGQLEPTNDNTTRIPGSDRQLIEGDRSIEIRGEQAESIEGDCYLTVRGQKYQISAELGEVLIEAMGRGLGAIRLSADREITLTTLGNIRAIAERSIVFSQGGGSATLQGGAWTFQNANGQKWTMGGAGGGGQWQWDLNGQAVSIVNCTGFTINGREVLVVGSTDTSGDTNNTRGY